MVAIADPDVLALAEARARDPFAVLGLRQEADGWWLRTLVRGAREVVVKPRDGSPPFDLKRHPRFEGLYETRVPERLTPPFVYDLAINYHDAGGTYRARDAYSFPPLVADFDLDLFRAGKHHHLGEILGAHPKIVDGTPGVRFTVWAPNAERVSVVGDWNGFDGRWHPMRPRDPYGVWELFIPDVRPGMLYKYEIRAKGGELRIKADPFAHQAENPPATASVVASNPGHEWRDKSWLLGRDTHDHLTRPMATYEVHVGSWRRGPEGKTWPNWRELGPRLVEHCRDLGFTHLELLPVAHHPYEGSWGYQVTGQYAPNARHGTPDDFRWFVDHCHQAGIAVIVDFVPGHFPKDDFALARFDGEPCFEYGDPREGEHRTWGTHVFNFRRPEVRNFLIAAALHWVRSFHIDGLRVDAVSSMLYRDYDREHGQWVANEQGGNANLEAVSFLQELTATVHGQFPGVLMIAEESTAWQGVTAPTHLHGLGFDLKWNMGWMHDTLRYLALDPVMRSGNQNLITFHQWYAYDDKWVLPLSHDEVVHGKGSLVDKMTGDWWRKLAQLRLLYGYQVGVPGRPLLFMGAEFGQGREWGWERALDWNEAAEPERAGLSAFLREALRIYRDEAPLHVRDDHRDGFQWVDCDNMSESILAFLRKAPEHPDILVACNFTPVPRRGYPLGVPNAGRWRQLLNSDEQRFGGSGVVGPAFIDAVAEQHGAFSAYLRVDLPPLGIVFLRAPE
ncbi:MAG: 1,4-alpha-glucan branching protein GlgB [Planctomycetes bacterium]|nr:1,4-alpha-glucan branching protein GlgB [Planctomycetota bacterium]